MLLCFYASKCSTLLNPYSMCRSSFHMQAMAPQFIILFFLFNAYCFGNAAAPPPITIGALLDLNSTIGSVAKQAMDLAVLHINRDQSLLHGSKLALHVVHTGSDPFLAASAATNLLEQEVVAIAGPQSSEVATFVAHIGAATQIPLISFAATDPALSRYEFPYFFRTVPSDALQMAAVAAIVDYYGWKEVTALYTNDDYGLDGMSALSDALREVGARLVCKSALNPAGNKSEINSVLTLLGGMESQVFVVHTSKDVGILLLSEAYNAGIMSLGYAWIVTNSVLATLDVVDIDSSTLRSIQGIIGTRNHIPNSQKLQTFLTDWKDFQSQQTNHSQLNVYGMYAYDSVWLIAYAMKSFFEQGWNFNFDPLNKAAGYSEKSYLKVLREGPLLRNQVLETKFNGTTGPIQLDAKGDNLGCGFEIVNMVGNTLNVIGYWTNQSGISASPPVFSDVQLHSLELMSQEYLHDAIWPGNSIDNPRAGLIRKDSRLFRIAVPKKPGYEQFVGFSNSSSNLTKFYGFCIDIFEDVLKYLPYTIHYEFVVYGNESSSLSYDDMIMQLANKVYDAVVGDVTITAKRMELVDFTQPFTDSGLVILVPLSNDSSKKGWLFLQPFTLGMWLTTGGFFIFTGIVIWMLERRDNPDFEGCPRKQIETALWYTFSTLYYTQKEDTRTILGRCVVIIWLFFILIITSSYTATLTTTLTVQQLSPTLESLKKLQESDVPVGYQEGSFVRDYLISMNISPSKLKPLTTLEAYANALKLGPDKNGVAAIVDELPYIQLFLASECGFTTVGQAFTKEGWGFAFRKDLHLATDFSAAILTVSENGELQRIHDFWLNKHACDSASTNLQSDQLDFGSFYVLFLIFGVLSVFSVIAYYLRRLWSLRLRSDKNGLKNNRMNNRVVPRPVEIVQVAHGEQNLTSDHLLTTNELALSRNLSKEKEAHNQNCCLSHHCISNDISIATTLDQGCSDNLSEKNIQVHNSEQTLSDLIERDVTTP